MPRPSKEPLDEALQALQKAFRGLLHVLPAISETYEALQKIYAWKTKKLINEQTLYTAKEMIGAVKEADIWNEKSLKQVFKDVIHNLDKAEKLLSELHAHNSHGANS